MNETGIRLTVNGAERSVSCQPDTPLLDVLRHDLGLAGPRFGCGMGLCGACMVLVGDRARASCDLPVSAVAGPVTTVEGLAGGGRLHPVQQAFIDEQAAQCGSCTSGMVMAAAALLRDRAAPTEQEVREGLDGNLCRCGWRRCPRAPARTRVSRRAAGRSRTQPLHCGRRAPRPVACCWPPRRRQFGEALASFQIIQQRLVSMLDPHLRGHRDHADAHPRPRHHRHRGLYVGISACARPTGTMSAR